MRMRGKAYVFGKNIDTDQIFPGRHLPLHEPQDIARHVMEGADPTFAAKVKPGDIIIASTNFGCGSSREQAVTAISHAGIAAVVAESFARIFYRNCINLGVPLLVCPGVVQAINDGDDIWLDLASGEVKNLSQGTTLAAEALSEHALSIIAAGGVKPLFKAKYGQ